ncbi:unnamed protein product [Peniophora sp. CBMAI 1063]|nr:unnamed protein product [Peniophora sp. CBMAI 1063]
MAAPAVGARHMAPADALRPFIFILPPELLSAIVEAVAAIEVPRPPVSDRDRELVHKAADPRMRERLWDHIVEGGSLGWMRLSHVCRAWRSHICESMPLLWAQHIGCFRSPGAVKVMLRRAGESTLVSVQSAAGEDAPGAALSPWDLVQKPVLSWSEAGCAGFYSRLESVRIVDLRRVVDDPPSFALNGLPSLRVLEVHHLHLDENSFDDEDKLLQPGAPIVRAPKLREIRFTNYFIPWTAPGLTHLSISLGHCNGLPSPALLNALTLVAPTIKVLELDYCLPGGFSEHVQAPYEFPQLRRLYLRDTDDCADEFLKILELSKISLTELDLTIHPDGRHWRDSIKTIVDRAVRLLRVGDPLTLMSATQAHNDDVIFGSLHKHICLAFSRLPMASRTPELTIAIENARHVGSSYATCLAETCRALGTGLPDIWRNVRFVDLDFPLWDFVAESRVLAEAFVDKGIRELRIIDPVESIMDSRGWEIPLRLLSVVFRSPTARLQKLWIVQHGEWLPERISMYCFTLAKRVEYETAPAEERGRALLKPPRIKLLRADFIESSLIQSVDEDGLIERLTKVAEHVELRFL